MKTTKGGAKTARKRRTKVWNVIFTQVDADDWMRSMVRVYPFSTQRKAEKFLAADYEKTLEGERADSILDVVHHENYGNNAVIKMGYDGRNEVETVMTWRVSMHTVDQADYDLQKVPLPR